MMNPATIRTIRDFLQLTHRDVAEKTGYDIRTVRRWEAINHDPRYTIPQKVEEWYCTQMYLMLQTAENFLEEYEAKEDKLGYSPEVTLKRFVNELAAGDNAPFWKLHNAAQGYILAQLFDATRVQVEYVTPPPVED